MWTGSGVASLDRSLGISWEKLVRRSSVAGTLTCIGWFTTARFLGLSQPLIKPLVCRCDYGHGDGAYFGPQSVIRDINSSAVDAVEVHVVRIVVI